MYSIGETIIYTTYGLCKVDNIVQKEFNNELHDYYILKPLHDAKASLQVQVNNPITAEKLRSILSADEVLALIKQIPQIEPYWIENENERKRHFSNILRSGTRVEIIGIIRSINEHHQKLKERGKKLHACDEQYYKDAEKIIYDEFAYVLNINKYEVKDYINKELEME